MAEPTDAAAQSDSGVTAPVPAADATQPTQGTGNPGESTQPDSAPDSKEGSANPLEASLSEETKSYLKSQGVEHLDAANLEKFVTSHKNLRAKKEEPTPTQPGSSSVSDALDKAMGVENPPATEPTTTPNPQQSDNVPTQPTGETPTTPATAPVQPPSTIPQDTTQVSKPSELEMYNFTKNLASEYPELADDIKTGKLYTDMADYYEGSIKPLNADGSFNVKGVLKFAELRSDNVKLKNQLAELENKPSSPTPAPKFEVDKDQPTVKELDKTSAQSIVSFSLQQRKYGKPVHPQFEEAQTFLQKDVSLR